MGRPVLIDFFAEWCGPCRIQTPTMEALKKEYEGRADVLKVDVDKDGKAATKYNIYVVPTIVLEKDGEELQRWLGVTTKEELAKAIDGALK